MRKGSRGFLVVATLLAGGAFAELAIEACAVPALDDRGKACSETCPSGLPCLQGICGGDSSDAPVILTACAAGVCAATAPVGWSGPFQLYDGNEANAPACDAPAFRSVLAATADLVSPERAGCAPCACGPVSGATCGPAAVRPSEGCFRCFADREQTALSRCYPSGTMTDSCGAAASGADLGISEAGAGTCTPSGGAPTLPPVRWSRIARGCVAETPAEQLGCQAGELCIPRPARPFEPGICVSQVGDVACPGTPYRVKRIYHQGVAEGRGCSPCRCLAPVGVACPVVGTRFGNTDCTGQVLGTQAAPGCITPSSSLLVTIGPAVDGSCPPSGGEPTGTATPSSPVTVCCSE